MSDLTSLRVGTEPGQYLWYASRGHSHFRVEKSCLEQVPDKVMEKIVGFIPTFIGNPVVRNMMDVKPGLRCFAQLSLVSKDIHRSAVHWKVLKAKMGLEIEGALPEPFDLFAKSVGIEGGGSSGSK